MHPSLAPHLHGDECKQVIEALRKCHADHPYKKFVGACNELKRALDACLYREYTTLQKKNLQQAYAVREKYQRLNRED